MDDGWNIKATAVLAAYVLGNFGHIFTSADQKRVSQLAQGRIRRHARKLLNSLSAEELEARSTLEASKKRQQLVSRRFFSDGQY